MPPALKTLELRWRQALRAAGRRPFTGRVATRAEDLLQLSATPRILLVRMERIGDVLVGVPVLRSLRARYPQGRIDLLVSRSNLAVRDAVRPFVDRLWCYEKTPASAFRLLRGLRGTRYDVVVDLVDNPSATAQMVVRWCGAPAAVGLPHPEAGLYTHAAPLLDRGSVHPVERLAQLLLPFGIDPASQCLDLAYPLQPEDIAAAQQTLGPTVHPLRFGVNVSGREVSKRWGSANYSAVVRHIMSSDPRFAVSVCGTPDDMGEVLRVALTTGAEAVPPQSSFQEFAAILHEFDLLLTPDTAAVHVAAAWKIPTVALYLSDPGIAPWLPYHTPHRAVADPNGIAAIPPDRVIAALEELIRERFAAVPGAELPPVIGR
ncbi:MAG TPA: glycosyltransferase family 9 protein [Gemmatimonadales bacterium]|nr:glycosyltransferase family 9 protein [Gemmatimonadales bacterium]